MTDNIFEQITASAGVLGIASYLNPWNSYFDKVLPAVDIIGC